MKPIVYPYKMSSTSARDLARALETIRVYPDRNYRQRPRHLVINWGNGKTPQWLAGDILNNPRSVFKACNKLIAFQKLSACGVAIPEYTSDWDVACDWLEDDHNVYARTTLTGHVGRGIVVMEDPDDYVYAPLYTKNFQHDREFRVHVGDYNGQVTVIDYTEKLRRNGAEANELIRNHSNGYVFARGHLTDNPIPDKVIQESINAVKALELNFGAVDVGYNTDTDDVAVFEVNTAPGLTWTTLSRYADWFKEISNGF